MRNMYVLRDLWTVLSFWKFPRNCLTGLQSR